MAIKYLKKSPKTSSTDDTKTTEIVKGLLKDIEDNTTVMGYPAIPLKVFIKQRKK